MANFEKIETLKEILKNETKIAFPDGNNLVMISPSDILYLKADNSYTQIVQVNGKKMITSRFLKNFEESLKGFPQFFRCHKSYIVNTDYTESFNKSNGGTIIIKDKIEIPISQDKVEEFLSIFKKIERK